MDMGMKGSAKQSTGGRLLLWDRELLLLRMQLSSTSLKLAPREASLWAWAPGSPPPPPSCASAAQHKWHIVC